MYENLEFQRKKEDVENSTQIIESKIKKFIQLTDYEKTILEKGVFTITVLNRIENAQKEAVKQMQSFGYYNNEIVNKEWVANDYFTKDDFERIIQNLNIIIKSFFVYHDTPKVPNANFHYTVLNDIEKILYDIFLVLDYMEENFLECGNFDCGEI